MDNGFFVYLSPTTCFKVASLGKYEQDALLFTKKLNSLVKHPIILNFKANITPIRLLLGLTDKKYRQELNNALRLGYITVEGNNLRLQSRTFERKHYRAKYFYKISLDNIRQFYDMAVIEHNLKQQPKGIKAKESALKLQPECTGDTIAKRPFEKSAINYQITLSVRSAARYLNCSISHAHYKLRTLGEHGLTLTKNRVIISKVEFQTLLASGNKGIRYDKAGKEYYYIGASLATVDNQFVVSQEKKQPFSFYNNDI